MLAGLVLKRPWWEGRMGILVPFGGGANGNSELEI